MAKTPPTEKTTKRIPISIKVRPETLAAYRALGPGWQTRMNADLDRAARRLGGK